MKHYNFSGQDEVQGDEEAHGGGSEGQRGVQDVARHRRRAEKVEEASTEGQRRRRVLLRVAGLPAQPAEVLGHGEERGKPARADIHTPVEKVERGECLMPSILKMISTQGDS